MALRKNQPQTRGVVAQRRQPSSVSNVGPSFIAISAGGGSSCEKTSCTKTAYCISNDMLTQLALLTVVNNELGKPNAGVLTNLCSAVQDCIDQEFIQDLIGDTIQGFDYNDALNQWLLENPFPIPYTLTSSGNSITLTIAGNPAQTATLVLSNSLTNTGLVITSSVNGVVSNTDITSAVQSLIDANTDSVTNTVAGHLIATHTSVDNTVVNINETVTSLGTPTIAGNILTIPFNNENGVLQTVTVDLGGITPTNDINISTATYTAATNIITLTETNGDVYTINLSEFSITTNTLPNGDVQIIQEGVVKATIPGAITILSYIPTCSGNVVSATNQVLTKDSLTTNTAIPTDTATTKYKKTIKVLNGCTEDEYSAQDVVSVLGDSAGSITTPITTDTPIKESTNPAQVGVLTNGSEIIVPKRLTENVVPTPYASLALATAAALASPVTIIAEVVNTTNPCENGVYAIEPNGDTKKIGEKKTPFLVPIPFNTVFTSVSEGSCGNGSDVINFTYTNNTLCSQLFDLHINGTIYNFIKTATPPFNVAFDNYVTLNSSIPDENGVSSFYSAFGQQNITPASGGNIEQQYSFDYRVILSGGQSVNIQMYDSVCNFNGLSDTNTTLLGGVGVTFTSLLVTPL